MNKKKIRRILDYQKTIEGMNNPFNKEVFYDLIELHYWLKFLEGEGTLTKQDLKEVEDWDNIKDDKTKNKIINELFIIMEIMEERQWG